MGATVVGVSGDTPESHKVSNSDCILITTMHLGSCLVLVHSLLVAIQTFFSDVLSASIIPLNLLPDEQFGSHEAHWPGS